MQCSRNIGTLHQSNSDQICNERHDWPDPRFRICGSAHVLSSIHFMVLMSSEWPPQEQVSPLSNFFSDPHIGQTQIEFEPMVKGQF